VVAYLRFELRRLVREPRLFVVTVLMPVLTYVVFTGVGDVSGEPAGVAAAAALLVGVGVAAERSAGWRQLRLTPLRPATVVAVRGSLTAVPSVVTVGLAWRLDHPARLPIALLLVLFGTLSVAAYRRSTVLE
jgi:ABC-2 type transport system permease protein